MADKLSKKQQMNSMVDTATQEYPMKDLYSKLKGAFSGQPFQAPPPRDMSKRAKDAELAAKMDVDDVRKSQADYGRAMETIKARENPYGNPMQDVLMRKMQPQQDISDQEAADIMQEFEPSDAQNQQMELKRQLIKRLNNQ